MQVDSAQLQALLASGAVEQVREDQPIPLALAESVPLIGGIKARSQGATGTGWVVAVLDTGVDRKHPFLAGKVVAEACFSDHACPGGTNRSLGPGSGRPCALSSCWHGTHVAGIAVGKGEEFSGVAPEAKLIAVQMFSDTFDCGTCTYFSDTILALDYVLKLVGRHRIAAVNMSIGGDLYTGYCDFEEMRLPIDLLRARGVATAIAAGNRGAVGRVTFPGCISAAVTVGATYDDPLNEAVTYYSDMAPIVDVLAPGSYITSSFPGGYFGEAEGTSMATPHVAGAFAALRSKVPTTSAGRIEAALKATGKPIFDPNSGLTLPRIDVTKALKYLRSGSAVVAQAPTSPTPQLSHARSGTSARIAP
jgi:subtilisin family serine protease